jgi:cell division protein FtsZ
LITTPGLINLDFADVKSVMSRGGLALMGIGRLAARASDRSRERRSPRRCSRPVSMGRTVSCSGLGWQRSRPVRDQRGGAPGQSDAAHPDANIIFGAVIDDTLGDEVRVTVIAAGFDGGEPPMKKVAPVVQATDSTGDIPTVQQPRTVVFDDADDDLDVPDFLK